MTRAAVEALLEAVRSRHLAFDPDQPRDEAGRWTDTGGSSGGAPTDKATARPRDPNYGRMVSYNVDRMHDYKGESTFDTPVRFNRGGDDYSGQGTPASGRDIREGLRRRGWTERPTATGTRMIHPDGKVQVRFEPHGKRERTYIEPVPSSERVSVTMMPSPRVRPGELKAFVKKFGRKK